MVSTRGVKIEFSKGEKVLCYEPDPSKTKVLYDSKVLNIQPKIDKNGKKVLKFLIHFQGWSSTWDRFVTEDLILKDTEENRQLQKELAERAQLIARNGNLYRKERKSGRRWGARTGSEQNGNMSAQSDSDQSDNDDSSQLILLPLPDTVTKALQYDEHAITSLNMVLNLPAEPNIVTILEMFLKNYALTLMKQVTSKRSNVGKANSSVPLSSTSTSITFDAYCRSVNLCRDVVDGVRIYTDFTLPQVLLYRQERGQYHAAITAGISREIGIDPDIKIKEEEDDDCGAIFLKKITLSSTPPGPSLVETIERRRSLRSHHTTVGGVQESKNSRKQSSDTIKASSVQIGGGGVIKPEIRRPLSQREFDVLEKILSWNFVPERVKQEKPSPPSLIYGAIHLCRVLLKLAEFIQKSDLPDEKVNVIMDLLNNLLKYLDDHPHWFGEAQYRINIYPSPPSEPITKTPD